MKKVIYGTAIAVVVLVAACLLALALFGGAMVKTAINTAGPAALGVPVYIRDARFSPLRGQLALYDLRVGNPEGFKTDFLLDVGRIEVDVNIRSLFTKTVVVRRVLVHEPSITYERGLMDSNIGVLLAGLGGPEAPAETESGRKVIIDELILSDGKVKVSATAAMGLSAPISLATVTLRDIGRESGARGAGVTDVVRIVLGTLLKTVVGSVGGVGGLAIDGVEAVGAGAVRVGEGAIEGVKNLGGGIGKALGGLLGGTAESNAPATPPPPP